MAVCIAFEAAVNRRTPVYSSPSSFQNVAWSTSEAALTSGAYSCPSGAHLLLTVEEVNALPRAGTPDPALMSETFFLSFGLVLGCFVVGKLVGSVLHIIRRG